MVNNTQYLTGGKSPNPLEPPSNFLASPGKSKVTLTWTDPPNATVEPSGQTYATWAYTQVVRKEGSQPTGPNDGTVVVQSSVRDQYATNGYVDTGLTNDTLYYYGAFAYNSDGVYSEGAFTTATPVVGVPLGTYSEGDIIKINEGGTPVEFYVANLNYEPTLNLPGRVLVVRKQTLSQTGLWNQINDGNTYSSSIIDSYLNSTYKTRFSSSVQNLIGTTNFTCVYGGSSTSATYTLNRACFTLSATELGAIANSNIHIAVEGTALSVASQIIIGYNESGQSSGYFTRSPWKQSDYSAYICSVTGSGSFGSSQIYNSNYYRPCFTLPSEALIGSDGVLIEGQPVPEQKAPLSALAEGTLITINENGAPVEFYVACQNYESTLNGEGRVLCVRKDDVNYSLAFALTSNEYANGQLDVWLNKTYINHLSDQVKSLIGETTIIYFKRTVGNWDPTQLTRAVFVYSVGEYGKTDSVDGTSPLPISDVLHNACPLAWTRTGVGYDQAYAGTNTSSKYRIVSANAGNCDTVPCFTLPSTALVGPNLALIETA